MLLFLTCKSSICASWLYWLPLTVYDTSNFLLSSCVHFYGSNHVCTTINLGSPTLHALDLCHSRFFIYFHSFRPWMVKGYEFLMTNVWWVNTVARESVDDEGDSIEAGGAPNGFLWQFTEFATSWHRNFLNSISFTAFLRSILLRNQISQHESSASSV